MTKKTKDIITDILEKMTNMADDIKKREEKHKKEIKESIEETIDWLNKNKNDVDAYIVLAVKNQDADENDCKEGVNALCGSKSNLLNLIGNINKDLMNDFISIKVKEKFGKDS